MSKQAILMHPPVSGNTLSIISFQKLFRKARFADTGGGSSKATANKRIMVVDDEEDISMIFKSGLQRRGFAVDVFNDPRNHI